jgi:hypothetical protein
MFNDPIELIRAERRSVPFFEGLEVDGYYMPDGEYRIGLESASRVLGYGRDWLSSVLRGTSPGTAKALRGMGFSENILKVQAYTDTGNSFSDRTISLDDFNRTIVYAVSKGKKAALALQLSLTKVALTDFFYICFWA